MRLSVRLPNHFRQCNFHCPYCVADLHAENVRYRWPHRENHRLILENLLKTPFELSLRLGPAGEFFLSKDLIEDTRYMSNQPQVAAIDLITNAALPRKVYERAFTETDTSKLAMTVSYHPTDVKDLDKWKDNVRYLQSLMPVSLVIVAYPPLLYLLPRIQEDVRDLNIPISVNGFIGSFNGKEYPYAYTDQEKSLLRTLSRSRHEYEYWIAGKRPGLCRAGMTSIYVDVETGNVFSCGMPVKHHLGELLTGPNFQLLGGPTPCLNRLCMCDSENYNPVVFDQYYERTGVGLRQYRYRYADLAKQDPRFDEWNIEYW